MKNRKIEADDLQHLTQFFPDLYEPQIKAAIIERGTWMEIKEGEMLMDIGQYIKFMPLIMSGNLKVLREDDDGKELLIYHVAQGQTCAMAITCCMGDARSNIRAVAEEDCTVIAIPTQVLDEWSSKYSSWKHFVFKSYQSRFEQLLQTIDSIAFKKLDDRLEKWLESKSKLTEDGIIHATHSEIANELHSSREVISRLLKKMENQGQLTLGRNKIEMH
ncbi:MAG: Crp/Fnr family transcriptional regulator [Bacteroidetes bacterium]|nr:Crp/Fnr family transcriptional regulator [Bacteroidota bacterium]